MLVDAYGSDNSDGSGDECTPQSHSISTSQNKSLSRSLPVPSNPSASASGSSTLSLPAPKAKKPKKITIDLPALSKDVSSEHDGDEARPAKRPRTEARGVGSSALFSMLPAPKKAAPVKEAPERILGSGKGPGLVFHEPHSQRTVATTGISSNEDIAAVEQETEEMHLPFIPVSVKKGKANISLEETTEKVTPKTRDPPSPTTVDLFSLNSAKPPASSVTTSTGLPSTLSISSAPKIDELTPPEPTPNDPYPGYYQLPSGTWAAYDSAYYLRFHIKWKADYDRSIRAFEKKEKGFEGADTDDTQEKALTKGAGGEPEAPRMNVKGSKVSKGARKRGQLASLLVEAYQNREVLEERIAEGRRNRKEAGNKYAAVDLRNAPEVAELATPLRVVLCLGISCRKHCADGLENDEQQTT
ncbi:mitotic checkpoint regulator, MAD2B-interacting-domain-containing protein [Lactarius quietus]|nr:mitotic checkpoint regulator, MAD2B-interacting-domain-containing protein [Lactarius quietus]